MRYIKVDMRVRITSNVLRIQYESSENTMMMDLSTIQSLELLQNLQDPKSRDCLFGMLNQTLTPMGARYLRSSILQPSTVKETIDCRMDALGELSTNEDMFHNVRKGTTILPVPPIHQHTRAQQGLVAWRSALMNAL